MAIRKDRSTVIPCLMYRDALAAIEWLCRAFGFQEKAVYRDDDGGVLHAELTLGGGMIMLGTIKDNDYGSLVDQPDQNRGLETQSPYLVVDEVETLYQRVQDNGGEIVIELSAPDYGGQHFTCRDPEGHLWNLGSYDPWASPPSSGPDA